MADASEALALVKARLCDDVDRIAADLPRLAGPLLGRRVRAVHDTAVEYGMVPLAEISGALNDVLGAATPSSTTRAYLAAMRDAAGCGRTDRAASQAYLASIGIRLAG